MNMTGKVILGGALACLLGACGAEVPMRTLELPPGKGNPRNSEGAFVTLRDGRILFVYSHYTAGSGGDHDPAHLAGRYSSDDGRTWTREGRVIVPNEGGMNVMSVSLLRLQSGDIALFYLLKNSEEDCRPVMRLSQDEGETWGAQVMCITDEVGYYVLNNDRVIQLGNGRLLVPVAQHAVKGAGKGLDYAGTILSYLSDDNGKSWRRSRTVQQLFDPRGTRVTAQEPGVVELKDGRVMMLIRTYSGCQYHAFSPDGGDTWSKAEASPVASQISPASVKRLLATGDLLLAWNDRVPSISDSRGKWWRVPLTLALSKDEGRTWRNVRALEGNPDGHFCYIAIHPVKEAVLLAYCAKGLAYSRITRVPTAWLYEEGTPPVSVDRKRPDLFGKAVAGSFQILETELGVWTAEAGHAEIYEYARGRGIRLLGGTNRVVTLALKEPADCKALGLGVERFASKPPYELTLEAKEGAGWRKVWAQAANTGVGAQHPVDWGGKAHVPASQFRFTCTSALGAILVDMPDISINAFFKD